MAALVKVFLRSSIRSEWQQRVQARETDEKIERLKALQREREAEQKAKAVVDAAADELKKSILDCVREQMQKTSTNNFKCSQLLSGALWLDTKQLEVRDEIAKEVGNELKKADFAADKKNVHCWLNHSYTAARCVCDVTLE
jgi:hypothetical protein